MATSQIHLPPNPIPSSSNTIAHQNKAEPSRLAIPLPLPHPSTSMPPPTSTMSSRKRKLAPSQPVPSSPSASEASADQDELYAPIPQPPQRAAAKKARASGSQTSARGGSSTATTGRGMSREALRKANHSLIERRRREKINFALGELRDMVPGLGEAEGGKGGEFKLEVLERTVIHMRELKARIEELEARPMRSPPAAGAPSSSRSKSRTSSTTTTTTSPPMTNVPPPMTRHSISPPTPSQSPDPNETDLESNLPPPFTIASRPPPSHSPSNSSPPSPPRSEPTPSITSLLASLPDRSQPTSRPTPASGQAYNPTLYLPFPTPSPTSPFLSYSHSTSASSSGPPEPSPFLAPLQGMALFGGALTLDNSVLAPSPADALAARNPFGGMVSKTKEGRSDKEQEEAANLLLAFSSPDVMRPTGYMTPLVVPAEAAGGRERRGTLDSEEFVLDGGVREGGGSANRGGLSEVRGKTAREILRM